MVVTGSYISADGIGYHITATNIGNRNIKIKTIMIGLPIFQVDFGMTQKFLVDLMVKGLN